ncbi:MAG: LCP family protein [Patescibacteria group bacterium]
MKGIFSSPYKLSAFIGIIFVTGMALGAVGYTRFFAKKTNNQSSITNKTASLRAQTNYPLPEIIEEKRETSKEAKTFNILLTGHGGAGHSGGGLMDAIIVVHVNVTDKKASLISFPRDFWFSGHKINSDPSLKDALTDVTGLPISNSISIDFSSFEKMIDSIGGVTVDVKKAYTDNFYPIRGKENELCGFSNEKIAEVHKLYTNFELEKQFTCRYETISYGVGLNDMTGGEALKYVRSRHGGNDFERSRHQFEVLKAILQKANIKSVASALDFVKTDLSIEKIEEILKEIGNPLEYAVSFINLSDQNVLQNSKSAQGAYILIPKDGVDIKQYIHESI